MHSPTENKSPESSPIKGFSVRVIKKALSVAVATAAFGLVSFGATPAMASGSGNCVSGDACLFYNSSQYGYGSFYGAPYNGNYTSDMKFGGGNGSGSGVQVKNHAAAAENMAGWPLNIYYNSDGNCKIACFTINSRTRADFPEILRDNNASQGWGI
ncbi:hypothetical protein AB0L68_16455 [Streptomyces sp. NPDC052164]|uniref:hypothetical protein n=1 Tax=Streptomyces sp. NPDC052164 TaxID=3155529 RepID=UPI00341C150E